MNDPFGFPAPAAPAALAPLTADDGNHVYVSVGHGQMMTDAMKPLGISMWTLTTPAPVREAGGRLFVDVTRGLSSPVTQGGMLEVFGKGDPLIRAALQTVLDRGNFIEMLPVPEPTTAPPSPPVKPVESPEPDEAMIAELISNNQASVMALQRDIATKSGTDLFEFILQDIQEMRRLLFDPRSHQVFMGAMDAAGWLNEHLLEWLGETNVADTLTQSAPNNVTSEMGMALLNVADVIRPFPDVVAFLQRPHIGPDFLSELAALDGAITARLAIQAFLDQYGMRCVGEIDITRPRWSEQPAQVLAIILANVAKFQPGEAKRRFDQGLQAAAAKEQDVLQRLQALPDGQHKAAETKRMIHRVRAGIGYREYPKYGMIRRYFEYKKALLNEAERLVQVDVLAEAEDIFYLSLHELHQAVRTQQVDRDLIQQRQVAFESYRLLDPPRVLLSTGEGLNGTYQHISAVPTALLGVGASAGIVEGRARVIADIAEADLEPGDILVTAFTDPSWTPVFIGIAGLVTEVGGMMTHGVVVAREFGLPAVVGVQNATRLIGNGQRIRLDGTNGYVELLPSV